MKLVENPKWKFFKERLAAGVLAFEYEKKDGTLRFAVGTTNPEIIAQYLPPNPAIKEAVTDNLKKKPADPNTARYFDFGIAGFRVVSADSLRAYVKETKDG